MGDSDVRIAKLQAAKEVLTKCMERTDEEIHKTEFEFLQLLNLTKAALECKEKVPEKTEEDVPDKINAQTLEFLEMHLKTEAETASEESDND